MSKWLDKKIVVLSLSAACGILLSGYVYQRQSFGIGQTQVASVNTTKTVHHVPVRVLDSSNGKYVSGIPETVSVDLEGPRNVLAQLTEHTFYAQTQDMAVLENGQVDIALEIVGLPSTVVGTLLRPTVRADVSQKSQSEHHVTVKVDDGVIEKGYEMADAVISPTTVTLIGKAETIAMVATVTAQVSSEQVKSGSFKVDNVPIVVRDHQQNVLDVQVQENVSVTIPVYKSGVKVPVEVTLAGQQEGYDYKIVQQDVTELVIVMSGTEHERVEKITATANVSDLTRTGVVEATVLVPNHVTISNPQPIKLMIDVTKR